MLLGVVAVPAFVEARLKVTCKTHDIYFVFVWDLFSLGREFTCLICMFPQTRNMAKSSGQIQYGGCFAKRGSFLQGVHLVVHPTVGRHSGTRDRGCEVVAFGGEGWGWRWVGWVVGWELLFFPPFPPTPPLLVFLG